MNTTAIRNVTKVTSLRGAHVEGPEKSGAGPSTGPGCLARAVALHLAGQREEALKQLQRAVAANEGSAEIYRAMGHIQFELGDFEESAKSYRTLAQLKPQYAMGWFNLAVSLERNGVWEDAAEAFHKASTLEPKHLEAHLGQGVCHLRTEDPKSALASFERCLELSPDHEDALFGKAVAVQSLGHPDEASQIYQQILKRNPESEESLSNLILIGLSKEDFGMVREHSERLLELHPESTVALEGLAAGPARPGSTGSRPSSARCWFPPFRDISKAGSTWRWRTRNRPLGTGRGSLRRGAEAAPAVLRGLHQPGNRARATGRRRRGPRRLRSRHQG